MTGRPKAPPAAALVDRAAALAEAATSIRATADLDWDPGSVLCVADLLARIAGAAEAAGVGPEREHWSTEHERWSLVLAAAETVAEEWTRDD